MARFMRCICPPGGTVTVQAPEFGVTIGHDRVVDFDQIVLPAGGAQPAQTLGAVLVMYQHLFMPVSWIEHRFEEVADTQGPPRASPPRTSPSRRGAALTEE